MSHALSTGFCGRGRHIWNVKKRYEFTKIFSGALLFVADSAILCRAALQQGSITAGQCYSRAVLRLKNLYAGAMIYGIKNDKYKFEGGIVL